MARNELRIRPFEVHSHFQSIANPSQTPNPTRKLQQSTFLKNQKIPKSWNSPGSAAMGGAPLNLAMTSGIGP